MYSHMQLHHKTDDDAWWHHIQESFGHLNSLEVLRCITHNAGTWYPWCFNIRLNRIEVIFGKCLLQSLSLSSFFSKFMFVWQVEFIKSHLPLPCSYVSHALVHTHASSQQGIKFENYFFLSLVVQQLKFLFVAFLSYLFYSHFSIFSLTHTLSLCIFLSLSLSLSLFSFSISFLLLGCGSQRWKLSRGIKFNLN